MNLPELTHVETTPQSELDHEYILVLEARLRRLQNLMILAQTYLKCGNTRRAYQALSQGVSE